MKVFSDSNWHRKSITGFVIFLQNVPVLWRSQLQRTVALSSTEAEYYAMSEAVKEIKFILQVVESLGITVEKPIIVHVDNIGAIFVAENASATKNTRHIDARYHFIRDFIIDGTIKISFIMSKLNKADIFTKNVTNEVFQEHQGNYVIHREVINLSSQQLEQPPIFDSGGVLQTSTTSTASTNKHLTSKYKRHIKHGHKPKDTKYPNMVTETISNLYMDKSSASNKYKKNRGK
jgi:hypothetical protein